MNFKSKIILSAAAVFLLIIALLYYFISESQGIKTPSALKGKILPDNCTQEIIETTDSPEIAYSLDNKNKGIIITDNYVELVQIKKEISDADINTKTRCHGSESSFYPEAVRGNLYFIKDSLPGNAECDTKAMPAAEVAIEYIKTKCSLIGNKKITFQTKDIKSGSEKNNFVFDVVETCSQFTDDKIKTNCFQSLVDLGTGNMNSDLGSIRGFKYHKWLKQSDEDSYVFVFSSNKPERIELFKKYISDYYLKLMDYGVPRQYDVDFFTKDGKYYFTIMLNGRTRLDQDAYGLYKFYNELGGRSDIKADAFAPVHKNFFFDGNTYKYKGNESEESINTYLVNNIGYSFKSEAMGQQNDLLSLSGDSLWNRPRKFYTSLGLAGQSFDVWTRPEDADKITRYFDKYK